MSSSEDKRRIRASILDRLLDDDPDRRVERPMSASELVDLLRNAIRRDLEMFVNTRRQSQEIPEAFAELRNTVINFGVPDFAGSSLADARRQREFLSNLEDVIRDHEPRFKSVRILPADEVDELDRSLRFRIDAVVYAEPAPEEIVFDSTLEPVSRTFHIQL